MIARVDSLDEYLRSYPRLCAAMIALTGPVLEPYGAAFLLRDAHERQRYDPGVRDWPVPTRERSLVAQAYQARHRLRGAAYEHTLRMVRTATRPAPKEAARPVDAVASRYESSLPNIILTTEGFINVDQVVEYRLRLVDPRRTDAIWGIDVLLSNGTSRLFARQDPGFEQLIDILEDQGYTISVEER